MSHTIFYFDLGSPFAYLAAERLERTLRMAAERLERRPPEPALWQPVLLGGLFKLNGRSSWALGDAERRQLGMAEVERRARDYGLPPVRWPDPWPDNYLFAMRVATFAFRVGRGAEFTRAAFRLAFAEGRDLTIAGHVLKAATDSGLDRQAAEEATREPAIKSALREATDAAHARGVFGVPSIAIGRELFWGDDRLEDAAALLGRTGAGGCVR